MLQDYDGTIVVEKGGLLDIEKWKDQTHDICHQCSTRLQNKDAIFALAELQIKNSSQLKKFKEQYEQFIEQMKSKFEDKDVDNDSESDTENDYESDSEPVRMSKKRKYIESYSKFNEGNASPKLNRVYDKFENSNKGFWQNLIVAFKGGEAY